MGQAGTAPGALSVRLSGLLSELRAGTGPQPGSPSPGKHGPNSCAHYSLATRAERKHQETMGLSETIGLLRPATLKGRAVRTQSDLLFSRDKY